MTGPDLAVSDRAVPDVTVAVDTEHATTPSEAEVARPLVVVIEDDYRSSLALRMLIDDWGYSCIAVQSSREAVQTLGHRLPRISAIVTDVEIDGQMRGIKDALAIASALGRPVPTIVTTGHGDFAAIAGPFPIIRKPFDPDILHAWLVHKLGYASS
jgi:DNA-binding NtrC family response regulator